MMTPDRSVAPTVSDFSELTMPEPQLISLDNGVTLHLIDAPQHELATMTLAWKSARAEAAAMGLSTGAAMMGAEMLREGSKAYTGECIADAIDFEGASLGSRATDHFTLVDLTVLAKSLPRLLPIVADIVANPVFPDDAFEAIRTKMAMQRDIEMSKPAALVDRTFISMMAGDRHPYAVYPLGDELRAITRDDLVIAHRTGFDNAEMHLLYCGPIGNDTVAQLTDFALSLRLAPDTCSRGVYLPYDPVKPSAAIVTHADPNQIAVSMGLPTIGRNHQDYIALRTAIIALGGHFGSRLNSNIRERLGLTYGISAALYGQAEGAYMNIQAQCRRGTAEQVISEIKGEIERLATVALSGDEFAALHSIVSSALAANVDSPLAVMRHHVSALLTNMPATYYADQWRTWQSLTPETVATMARQYLHPADLRIAVTD